MKRFGFLLTFLFVAILAQAKEPVWQGTFPGTLEVTFDPNTKNAILRCLGEGSCLTITLYDDNTWDISFNGTEPVNIDPPIEIGDDYLILQELP
jgi:hypothetical protein